jgi:hypothetical protein
LPWASTTTNATGDFSISINWVGILLMGGARRWPVGQRRQGGVARIGARTSTVNAQDGARATTLSAIRTRA